MQVGVYQESVLSPLFFANLVVAIMKDAKEGVINEILYVEDLVLISESEETLREKFLTCNEAFKHNELKVNLKKPI